MEQEELKEIVGTVVAPDVKVGDKLWETEIDLFIQSMFIQVKQLKRTPTEHQIKQAWARWKRERKLDASAETVDTTTLWKKPV